MNRYLILCLTFAFGLVGALPAYAELGSGTYKIDQSHSKVGFEIAHMVFSSVEGRFKSFSGDLQVNSKKKVVNVTVEVASINTEEPKRDKHLRSPDFFNAAKYPDMIFKSSKITGNTHGNFKIHGKLTLHGITRPLVLKAKYLGEGKDPWGNMRYGFKASGHLVRQDFGLKWNKLAEAGPLVGDDVELSIKLELVKQ